MVKQDAVYHALPFWRHYVPVEPLYFISFSAFTMHRERTWLPLMICRMCSDLQWDIKDSGSHWRDPFVWYFGGFCSRFGSAINRRRLILPVDLRLLEVWILRHSG